MKKHKLFVVILMLAPILGLAQNKHSGIGLSFNQWDDMDKNEFNIYYLKNNTQNFISTGIIFPINRHFYIENRSRSLGGYFIPHDLRVMRYGLFGEYGIYPNRTDTGGFRPYFSLIGSIKYYYLERAYMITAPYNVWEKEINIGYGIRRKMGRRFDIFSRVGYSVTHLTFNPLQSEWPVEKEFANHIDLRLGATFYLN